MRKFSSLLFLSLITVVLSAFIVLADPIINLNLITSTVVCSTGNDTARYTVSASEIPANTNIVIYQSTDSTFNPYLGQGDSIGFIPGNSIPKDTVNFGNCVKILGEFIDACGPSGQEGRNEYIILTSGKGIKVSNLGVDFSSQNNSGAANADINTGATPCGYKTPSASLISGLRIGSCNTSNVIPASPTDSIPPNAIILLFTSDSVTAGYSINGLCNLGYPIYVLQSACVRTIGAFTNAPRCDAPSRYRTTLAIDKRQNCTDNFTYDLCSIFDKDGTYAIRQQGTDTASVANNGIRRNVIDSCGGIDYTQLNFSADTTLKFSISSNFCNTGYHYIKAITHPNGTQPVSNTIRYKVVCNDITATSSTTNICSGDSVKINISSTDPNSTFSWTVNGGTNITGAIAGTGSTIKQVLTYSGTTKDSVTYTAISNDAGCTQTQTIKVVVKKCTSCDTWLKTNNLYSYATCGDLDIVGDKVTIECSYNKFTGSGNHLVTKHTVASNVNYALGQAAAEITTANNGYVLIQAPCESDDNKTYHAAMVYDGTSLKFYRDGFLLAQAPCSGNLVQNDIQTTIGNLNSAINGATFEQFKGHLNEVRIWNVARTQQQIRDNMNTSLPNPATQTGLKGYYIFNDLLNKQGNATFNAVLGGSGVINQTNPQCDFTADSCGSRCDPNYHVQILGAGQVCNGSDVVLAASGQFDSIRWNNGSTDVQIDITVAGDYTLFAFLGVCSTSTTVRITECQQQICNPTIIGNRPFCQGDSITLDAGSGFTSYLWSTGAITQTISVKTGGKYVVSVTGQNCTGKDSVNVTVNPIQQLSISGNTSFCFGSQTTLTANADSDSLRWSTNETTTSISVSQAQNYSVTVYKNGCSNSASVQVSLLNPPATFTLGNDTTFCGNFSKILSTGIQSTQWNTDVTASQISVTEAGTYIATVSNNCGNESDTIIISKNDLPFVNLGNDTSFCDGELVLNAPVEMRSYIWSTGSQSSSITVTTEGTYSVKITDSNGCSGSDAINITSNCANDLWIPNAFTPNNDGVNDVFLVRGNPRNTTIEKFVIYNRWGNKVFEVNNALPDDITNGWDGKYKGDLAPFEVYGYEVITRFSNGEKKTLKGNVTLLK